MKSRITKIAIGLGVAYLALCGLARIAYPKILFPAPNDNRSPRATGGELVSLPPGTRAFYLPPREVNGRVVVMFHGNGETIVNDAMLAVALNARYGLGALCVEYRGYGLTYGPTPTERSIFEDGEAGLELLKSKGIADDRIVLYGYSLGTSVAAEMAARGHGSKLVLLAPFTSVVDMGYRYAPFLPMSLIVKDRLDTLGKANRIHIPTLVVHGDADEIVPFEQGEKVASRISGARFQRIAGGHHTTIMNDPAAAESIMRFVSE